MEMTEWIYVVAVVLLVCVTVLGVTDKLLADQIQQLFIWIVTIVITGSAGFYLGKHKGYLEANEVALKIEDSAA